MQMQYAPGCALMLYKPELGLKMTGILAAEFDVNPESYLPCCHAVPKLEAGSVIINTCAGCDRRFRSLYEGIGTTSLWEVLARSETFPFPDYSGVKMSIHDACPTRTETRVHDGVRALLHRMNIEVIEPERTRTNQVCCGDSLHRRVPTEQLLGKMRERADQMPCEDVVVYCVSCIKSFANGGKTPRYIVDLLFGEPTLPGDCDPDRWHEEVDAYIASHMD